MNEKEKEKLLKKIEEYTEKIKKDPDNDTYYYNRGNTLNNLKEYDKAIEDYNKVIELDPKHSFAYNNRGNSYYYKKLYDNAIKNYNKAIELNPNYAFAYNNRGLAFSSLESFDEAIKDFDKAIELNPNYVSAYNNRGITFKNLGNFDEAIKDFDKAIELNPNYVSAYNNRGITFKNLGNFDEAIKDYNKAIELNPNYAFAYNNRGLAFSSLGNFDEAIIDFDKAIELNPNYVSAYNNREFVDKILKNNKSKDLKKNIQQNNKIVDNIENSEEAPILNENEEIQDSVENKSLTEDPKNDSSEELEEGYLIFADILGWKGIWKKYTSNKERIELVTNLLRIRDLLKKEIEERNCSINLISDTFIISSNDFEMSNKISKKLIELCLEKDLVIRGAISYGEYYNRDTVYLGPAVDEAASWHDEGEEIGIFYTPSAKQEITNKKEFKKYDLPKDFIKLKSGEINTFFINWYDNKSKEKFYEIFNKIDKTKIEVYLKYLNTEKKIEEYKNQANNDIEEKK